MVSYEGPAVNSTSNEEDVTKKAHKSENQTVMDIWDLDCEDWSLQEMDTGRSKRTHTDLSFKSFEYHLIHFTRFSRHSFQPWYLT